MMKLQRHPTHQHPYRHHFWWQMHCVRRCWTLQTCGGSRCTKALLMRAAVAFATAVLAAASPFNCGAPGTIPALPTGTTLKQVHVRGPPEILLVLR